jgi:hypothetical protein
MSSDPMHPTIPPCPSCGGQRVGALCYEGMIGREAKMGGVAAVVRLKALVRTVCGQTTLYAESIETLKKELLKHPEGFTY